MTEVRGGHVIDVLKGAGKMRGAVEPAFFGDGLNGVGRGLQQVFGLTQAVLQDIFMRGAAEIFFECADKVGRAQQRENGECVEFERLCVMFLNMLQSGCQNFVDGLGAALKVGEVHEDAVNAVGEHGFALKRILSHGQDALERWLEQGNSPKLLKRFGKRNMSLYGISLAFFGHLSYLLDPYTFNWVLFSCFIRAS